jgi:hypothetical protein
MATIRVSKIDAARRQIDVAIRLLFSHGDAVAIHTLASAGARILRDLCEQQATPSHVAFKDVIRPGKEKEFNALLNRAANFYKHADRDADEIPDGVEEEVNDAVLMIATMAYADLGYTPSPEMTALHYSYVALHPNVLNASVTKTFDFASMRYGDCPVGRESTNSEPASNSWISCIVAALSNEHLDSEPGGRPTRCCFPVMVSPQCSCSRLLLWQRCAIDHRLVTVEKRFDAVSGLIRQVETRVASEPDTLALVVPPEIYRQYGRPTAG